MFKLFISLLLVLQLADANYFRYGDIRWERIVTADPNQYLVKFQLKLGINDVDNNKVLGQMYDFEGNVFQFGDGTNGSLASEIVSYDAGWFYTNPVVYHNFSGPGPWYAQVESGQYARDSTLMNNDLKKFRLRCRVDLSNNNLFSPVIAEPIVQNWYWNQTDLKLFAWDPQGDTITWRLSTNYEMGDPLDPDSLGQNAQIQEQPYQLSVDATTGVVSWTKARDLPPGKYQLQIMFVDSKGGEVPIDFILINSGTLNDRPVIGGGATPAEYGTLPLENFLVNQPITFSIEACDATDVMRSINSTETPLMLPLSGGVTLFNNGTHNCASQSYIFTPTVVGNTRHCFHAYDVIGSVSQIHCTSFNITGESKVYTLWQAPTKQITGGALEVWFTGYFLSARDRVAWIFAHENCADLPWNAGVQVEGIWDTVPRVSSGPVVNWRRTTANLVAGDPGSVQWCYKMNAQVDYGTNLTWRSVERNPPPFDVIDTGIYRISTLPACPLYDRAFRFVLYGHDLIRFDKVKFLTPSVMPPVNHTPFSDYISSINCEDLTESDGTMIKDFPVLDGLSPGFVVGAERVEFPWKFSRSDVGQYMCYKPYQGAWRMIQYIKPLAESGVSGVSNVKSITEGTVQVTLDGLGLAASDQWAAYPFSGFEDCQGMFGPNANLSNVYASGVSVTNAPAFNISGTTYPGINLVSLCYLHNGVACKIADLDLRDSGYGYTGIPDPLSTTSLYPYVDFEPFEASVNESMIYEFTGYVPYGYILNDPCVTTAAQIAACTTCEGFEVKVAKHGSCTGNAKGGEARLMSKDRRVTFRLQETGLFRFCVKHRIDWEPVARGVAILPQGNLTNADAFFGFSNCAAYMSEFATDSCGCFLGGYPGHFVDVATDHPVDAAVSTSLNFNQGCCASPAANRTQVGIDVKLGVSRPWGYCTHTPVSTPAPYPPFDCEAAKAGTVGNSV